MLYATLWDSQNQYAPPTDWAGSWPGLGPIVGVQPTAALPGPPYFVVGMDGAYTRPYPTSFLVGNNIGRCGLFAVHAGKWVQGRLMAHGIRMV